MTKQSGVIVSFGYSCNFLVQVDKLSAFLKTLEGAPKIDTSYIDGRTIHYICEGRNSSPRLEMLTDEHVIVTEKEMRAMAAAEQERREAEKAETQAA